MNHGSGSQQWSKNVSRIGGPESIATNIYSNILQGIARSLWSGHIIQVKLYCAVVVVIMCYCAKYNQHA